MSIAHHDRRPGRPATRSGGASPFPASHGPPAGTARPGSGSATCRKVFGRGASRAARPRPALADRRPRRVRLPDRRVRLRQEHAAEPGGRARRRRPPARPRPTAGRIALMFQEAALFPWLTAARQRGAGRCGCAACPAERRRAGRRAARPGAPGRLRRQAAARAVRRHAPAGRAGPRAGPGRRRAADGRAVRRARRDDPRPAARRARADLARARRSPCCSSPTTCARRSGSATGWSCSAAARAGSSRSSRWPIRAPAADRLARGVRAGRRRSPTGCARRWSAMAADTGASGRGHGGRLRGRRAGRARPPGDPAAATQPAAAAGGSGPRPGRSCWRSRSCSPSGRSSSWRVAGRPTCCPARPTSSPTCGSELHHAAALAGHRHHHAPRGDRLRARRRHRHGDRGAACPGSSRCGRRSAR